MTYLVELRLRSSTARHDRLRCIGHRSAIDAVTFVKLVEHGLYSKAAMRDTEIMMNLPFPASIAINSQKRQNPEYTAQYFRKATELGVRCRNI